MKIPLAILFLLAALSLHAQTNAADSNALPALLPPYGELPPTFWEQHGTMTIIGGFVFVAIAVLGLWLIFRPRPAAVLPPEALARNALSKLLLQPEDGKVLSQVSQILRRYVIKVFQLPPGELTSAEFYAALARNDQITLELGESVSRFLRECDQRKFSTAHPSTPFHAAEQALNLISLAEKLRPPVARTK